MSVDEVDFSIIRFCPSRWIENQRPGTPLLLLQRPNSPTAVTGVQRALPSPCHRRPGHPSKPPSHTPGITCMAAREAINKKPSPHLPPRCCGKAVLSLARSLRGLLEDAASGSIAFGSSKLHKRLPFSMKSSYNFWFQKTYQ